MLLSPLLPPPPLLLHGTECTVKKFDEYLISAQYVEQRNVFPPQLNTSVATCPANVSFTPVFA
jgi:hypothetical protein